MKTVKVPEFMKYLFDHAFLVEATEGKRRQYMLANAKEQEKQWMVSNFRQWSLALKHGYEVMPNVLNNQEAVQALFQGKRIQKVSDNRVYEVIMGNLCVELEENTFTTTPESPFSWDGETFLVLEAA